MPLAAFPFGVTAQQLSAANTAITATANSTGSMDCLNLYVAGTSSVSTEIVTNSTVTTLLVSGTATISTAGRLTIGTGTGATMIGERMYVPFTFTSATGTTYYASPFLGNIIDCWVTCDTTPRTCSGFTLYAGGSAAGSVSVATVALAYATAIGQQVQPALTLQAAITATGFAIVVTTAGSAANFSGVFVVQRSA